MMADLRCGECCPVWSRDPHAGPHEGFCFLCGAGE